MKQVGSKCCVVFALTVVAVPLAWSQTDAKTVYRCPGNPVLYTDALSGKEAHAKGCTTIEGAPVTVVHSVKPRSSNGQAASGAASRPGAKVDPNDQRARDSDARHIIEAELKREEEQLAALRTAYNNGTPERTGDERNFQKYLDRAADMKASIDRKESDIAAIKRELAKLPQ